MNDNLPDQPPDWEPGPPQDPVITISPGWALFGLIQGAGCLFFSGMLAHIALGPNNYKIEALGLAVFFLFVGFNIIWKLVSLAASWRRKKK